MSIAVHGPRTTFTGYYGMQNFGDDLFGVVCTAAARRYWGGEPRLAGPSIDGLQVRYTMPRWYPANWYGAAGMVGKASRYYSFGRAVRGSDVLVMGGGSVINARHSFRKPMMLSRQRLGVLELAAVGVSIGPFENTAAESATAQFVDRFSYVAVRDRRSYELGVSMGLGDRLHLGRDLAGLLPLLMPSQSCAAPAPSGQALRIGIAPCNYREQDAPDKQRLAAAMVAALARRASRQKLVVDIFSLNGHPVHGDETLARSLQQELDRAGIESQLSCYRGRQPLAMLASIGRCDAFISGRLHGAIAAYLQGVPFTVIDYHPKCRDFADDVGLGPAQRLGVEHEVAGAVESALEAMLDFPTPPLLSPDLYADEAQNIFRCAPWARQPRY